MKNLFYKSSFVFQANRYEEWQSGRCISQGKISTEIVAEVNGNDIYFELSDIGNLRIPTSFEFEILGEDFCILSDRIQYVNNTSDFNPITPIVCHIFYSGDMVQYVRFAMTNPDRLIEFYGTLVCRNQPSLGGHNKKVQPETRSSATQILRELDGYGMLNTDAIMERAVKLYNNNANVSSILQAQNIVESLRLFVKAHQLDKEEEESDGDVSFLRSKILMFIALCNYKIANINQAYCIAKQGLDAIDKAIENSIFTGLSRDMFGEDALNEIISTIETNHPDKIIKGVDYYQADPEEIDIENLQKVEAESSSSNRHPAKEMIEGLIEVISHLQEQLVEASHASGDNIEGYLEVVKVKLFFETFKLPLFFAWQGYRYGWHTDWCEEGDSLVPFMLFETNLIKNTQELIDMLKTQSPFAQIENSSKITNSLIYVYQSLISDLENGIIKI